MIRKKLFLASASPRRKAMLNDLGINFEVLVSNMPEKPEENETPHDYVVRNSVSKALASIVLINMSKADNASAVILAADTIVVSHKNQILEKPQNSEHAFDMLNELRDNTHKVISGFCLVDVLTRKVLHKAHIETIVQFRNISVQEIKDYIATDEPFDKAGAYGIQGKAACFIKNITGSYTNVVGLPLAEVVEMLEKYANIYPFKN